MSDDARMHVSRKGESAKQISAALSQVESELLNVRSSLISLRTESSLGSIPLCSAKVSPTEKFVLRLYFVDWMDCMIREYIFQRE